MDLRVFLKQLQASRQLKVVEGADWDLEIGSITELSDEGCGPALLFDHIKDYPAGYRVASNLITAPSRLATALGFSPDISRIELARQTKDRFRQLTAVPPVYVETGPLLENVYEGGKVDLLKLPVPRWHDQDGGRYLGTADMVIMREPNGNWVNVGTYRVQVHDRNTLGLYISGGHHGRIIRETYWAQGKPCPVAVVFGEHPLVWLPCCMAMPWGTEEYSVIGGLLGKPLPLIRGEATGLPIPAYGEIAIEGVCPPPEIESHEEGPFGEWTGYYGTGEHREPVIKVTRLMHRNDPIITGGPPLKPPANGSVDYAIRAGNIWHELEKLGIPGIKGVWNMRAGGSRYLIVVSIEQKYAGHAKQVGMAVTSGGEGAYHGRFVIVVDEDIDPTNDEDVLWALATRCDPATGIEIVHDCWSTPADPTMPPDKRARGEFTNSRAIMLAVRPYHWRKEFPKVNRASDELRARTLKKWPQLGLLQ